MGKKRSQSEIAKDESTDTTSSSSKKTKLVDPCEFNQAAWENLMKLLDEIHSKIPWKKDAKIVEPTGESIVKFVDESKDLEYFGHFSEIGKNIYLVSCDTKLSQACNLFDTTIKDTEDCYDGAEETIINDSITRIMKNVSLWKPFLELIAKYGMKIKMESCLDILEEKGEVNSFIANRMLDYKRGELENDVFQPLIGFTETLDPDARTDFQVKFNANLGHMMDLFPSLAEYLGYDWDPEKIETCEEFLAQWTKKKETQQASNINSNDDEDEEDSQATLPDNTPSYTIGPNALKTLFEEAGSSFSEAQSTED